MYIMHFFNLCYINRKAFENIVERKLFILIFLVIYS